MKLKFLKAFGEGTKEAVAIALITLGVQMINSGDYISGGALVTGGWILLIIDRYLI